jgi:hypothetical protein
MIDLLFSILLLVIVVQIGRMGQTIRQDRDTQCHDYVTLMKLYRGQCARIRELEKETEEMKEEFKEHIKY